MDFALNWFGPRPPRQAGWKAVLQSEGGRLRKQHLKTQRFRPVEKMGGYLSKPGGMNGMNGCWKFSFTKLLHPQHPSERLSWNKNPSHSQKKMHRNSWWLPLIFVFPQTAGLFPWSHSASSKSECASALGAPFVFASPWVNRCFRFDRRMVGSVAYNHPWLARTIPLRTTRYSPCLRLGAPYNPKPTFLPRTVRIIWGFGILMSGNSRSKGLLIVAMIANCPAVRKWNEEHGEHRHIRIGQVVLKVTLGRGANPRFLNDGTWRWKSSTQGVLQPSPHLIWHGPAVFFYDQ